MSRSYLNLGCGGHFDPAWTNIDIYSAAPEVRAHDLRRGLPYADGSFEAVYSAHFMEHLAPAEARRLLAECQRVLKPGGVIRVVVPDLEQMARWYLDGVERARSEGDGRALDRHALATTLLIDQLVRTVPGGELRAQVVAAAAEDRGYLRDLLGEEADAIWRDNAGPGRASFWQRLRRQSLRSLHQRLVDALTTAWIFALSGRHGAAAYREGRFRHGGEVHKWMYDGVSMTRLLTELGFGEVRAQSHDRSRIPGFGGFALDGRDGAERRPGSLYIEGVKP